MPNLVSGPCTILIKRPGEPDIEVCFADVALFEVDHDIEERPLSGFTRAIRWKGTKLTISGRLKDAPLPHQHQWKPDGMGWTDTTGTDYPHEGLLCDCGATACGNLTTGEVHNIREL